MKLLDRIFPFLSLLLFGNAILISSAAAHDVQLWGKPLNIHGYLSQSMGFGIAGEHFDNQKRFQSAIVQGLIEATYEPERHIRMFLSGKLNADWAYQVPHGSTWRKKGFNKSRDRLYVFDSTKDLLNEANVTWHRDSFYLRVGKQIVRWGETDGFRLMDRINPVDQRRGLADVEFENTILPIWLVRTEYAVPVLPAWLQTLSFQGIFNPHVQFRPNEGIQLGNSVSGIWAPNVTAALGGRYPLDFAHIGSADELIVEPKGAKGYEYALRAKGAVRDTTVTLNYYYGRDKDPVTRVNGPFRTDRSPYDGRLIIHPNIKGFYPVLRFAGGTVATDIDPLQSTAIGGVAPVFRLEAFYAFGSTFTSNRQNMFNHHDEIRWAAGADWKVKIPLLNPFASFTISPQFFHRRIIGYPDNDTLTGPGGEPVRKNNYQSSLMISTGYLNNKIQPSVFWLRNWSERADFYRFQVTYDWSHHWRYTAGTLFFNGAKKERSFDVFSHKDQAYFTVNYRF